MEWRLAIVFSAAPIVRGRQHQPMLKIGQHRDKGDERTRFVPDLWAIGPLSRSLAKACSWKREISPHRSFDSRQYFLTRIGLLQKIAAAPWEKRSRGCGFNPQGNVHPDAPARDPVSRRGTKTHDPSSQRKYFQASSPGLNKIPFQDHNVNRKKKAN